MMSAMTVAEPVPASGTTWVGPAVPCVPPLSLGTREALIRSAQEADWAMSSERPEDRFIHAHMSALRAATALIETQAGGVTGRRRRPQNVWDGLAKAFPELGAWAGYFRDSARRRELVEAGLGVGSPAADELLGAAMDFAARVRAMLGLAEAGDGLAWQSVPAGSGGKR